jgi:tellurite resistance protein
MSNPDTSNPFSPQDCLIAVMIATSASDLDVGTAELVSIQRIVNHMPIFADYDVDHMSSISDTVFSMFEQDDGLDALFGVLRSYLPQKLHETAYALACDVAAADGKLDQAELELLAEMRYQLDISRLHAAAIETGARARHVVL